MSNGYAGMIMQVGYLRESRRVFTRSAALLLVSGLAAGCSSGAARFTDGLFTGSTTNMNQEVWLKLN